MKGIGALFSRWKKGTEDIVCLMQRADGIGLAHVRFGPGGKPPLLAHSLFQPLPDPSSWSRVAADLVHQCRLEKAGFIALLDRSAYKLFPADAPSVPREEWALNMRWKIGDRISYPVEQAVVEVFDLPGRTVEEDSGKIYVAVAEELEIQKQVDFFLNAGLNLLAIDIVELALGRLTDGLPEDDRGVGLLFLEPGGGVVIVRRNRRLYLARSIETEPGISLELRFNALALTLRQTFDFYENNFFQPPLEFLFIVPTPLFAPRLLPVLGSLLAMQVSLLPMEKIVFRAPDIQEVDLFRCLPAVGAAFGFSPGL